MKIRPRCQNVFSSLTHKVALTYLTYMCVGVTFLWLWIFAFVRAGVYVYVVLSPCIWACLRLHPEIESIASFHGSWKRLNLCVLWRWLIFGMMVLCKLMERPRKTGHRHAPAHRQTFFSRRQASCATCINTDCNCNWELITRLRT